MGFKAGDSQDIKSHFPDLKADLLFSCPPYADLEVYSDDPRDLSNMPYSEFLKIYKTIIKNSCDLLDENRFAIFVVGEVRSKRGEYYNFIGDTISSFLEAGLSYYNELVLLNPAGSLPIRIGKQFSNSRKIGKMHQNVLIFYKGDVKKIPSIFSGIDLSDSVDFNEQTEQT